MERTEVTDSLQGGPHQSEPRKSESGLQVYWIGSNTPASRLHGRMTHVIPPLGVFQHRFSRREQLQQSKFLNIADFILRQNY